MSLLRFPQGGWRVVEHWSLLDSGHQDDSITPAFCPAYLTAFNKKEKGMVKFTSILGLTPIFQDMSILSPEPQRREFGICQNGGPYLHSPSPNILWVRQMKS